REVIADSIELVASAHQFDALVTISGCDKTIPGAVMALARLDIPGLMLYGGSIKPGWFKGEEVTIQHVFEAVGEFAAGRISEAELHELEEAASPGAGACGGQFTANTMAMEFEAISERTPLLCDLQPGGRYAATDLYEAGGVPLVLKRLLDAGILNGEVPTVTGRTIGEHAAGAAEREGQDVVRPLAEPIKPT